MVTFMARGRLRPSLRLSPRPRLIPTSCTDVVLVTPDTTDMDSDTTDTDSDTMADSDTTARGLLMLRPIPTLFTEDLDTTDMDWDTSDTTATMDSDMPTMARGRLRLRPSPRPRLIPTSCTDVVLVTPDTTDMDSDTMAMDSDTDTADSTTANRLHQDLSVNHRLDLRQKWIVISLKFPSPVLQFQCYHTKSLVMVSRKQENQSGKTPTNIEISK